eukprot:gnl/Hemi2/23163_TR7766_c0_g1_i2.p1 gnl/Hemi2/23163_TR7766_c0_g1~~gnl/Hemi2/23163_TR7766_c0_g1_i2.p1  ORF type:complete len:467 (+),score=98.20 gnl/Hemi2/23163_TR7766_c0_g1_i2:69-1469(+)
MLCRLTCPAAVRRVLAVTSRRRFCSSSNGSGNNASAEHPHPHQLQNNKPQQRQQQQQPQQTRERAAPVVTAPPQNSTASVSPAPPPKPKKKIIGADNVDVRDLVPKISVVGLGGAGGNAVDRMLQEGGIHSSVRFVIANTDDQALEKATCPNKVQLGDSGLGAGADPLVGAKAAKDSLDSLLSTLGQNDMVFVTAGMGGGTGMGSAPVVARALKERGVLVVAVVSLPFAHEGKMKYDRAEAGMAQLLKEVDTLIVVSNENLLKISGSLGIMESFKLCDKVLYTGVRAIVETITSHGYINLDFADVAAVMKGAGYGLMGVGIADGADKARTAVEQALSSPLLGIDLINARQAVVNVTGGPDLTLVETEEVIERIRSVMAPGAHLIYGTKMERSYTGKVEVFLIVTGVDLSKAVLRQNIIPSKKRSEPVLDAAPPPDLSPAAPQASDASPPPSPQRKGWFARLISGNE